MRIPGGSRSSLTEHAALKMAPSLRRSVVTISAMSRGLRQDGTQRAGGWRRPH